MRSKTYIIKFLFFVVPLAAVSENVCAQNTFPATGNVGIGTSNPDALLNINTPANDSTLSTLKFGIPGDKGNTIVAVNAPTGGYNIDFATWRDVYPDQIGARIRAERTNDWQAGSALKQAMDLVFSTSIGEGPTALTEHLRIKSNGYVGIGTSAPTQMLSVDGNINAKEVIVTTSGWPDYVFKKDYNLPSLESLSDQISTDGHLPDMPSAEEIKQKGLSLGAINKLQQQKIEELTLYVIEQHKENKAMTAQLQKQQAEMEALKKEVDALAVKQAEEK